MSHNSVVSKSRDDGMRHEMKIWPKHKFSRKDVFDIYRSRARASNDLNPYSVTFPIDMEIDQYDELDPYYLYVKNEKGEFCGCSRLLPTCGPYMMKDIFPQLLGDMPAPNDSHVWELSRLVVIHDEEAIENDIGLAGNIMRGIIEFGIEHKITHIITAANPFLEKVFLRSGVIANRLTPVIKTNAGYKVGLLIKTRYD